MELKNFGENVSIRPAHFFSPKNEKEVLDILAAHRGQRIRAIGRLHSWSEAPGGDEVLLDLRHLSEVQFDSQENPSRVTAGAGCQVKKIVSELEKVGATLPSVGLIDEQTIAGATATGTHGSGKHSLSHYVEEVRVAIYDPVTGEPVIRTIDSGVELLAARCSLGCLGVILSIGLPCRSQYHIEYHARFHKELEDVLAKEDEYPLQQFLLVPWHWSYLAQHRREVTAPRSFFATLHGYHWYLTVDYGLHMVMRLLVNMIGIRALTRGFYRFLMPISIGLWTVVDKAHAMLTMEHELFRHIEIEIFVKRSRLAETMRFVRVLLEYADGREKAIDESARRLLADHDLSETVKATLGVHTHHYPICVRRVLPDATLISMASSEDEPWYAVSFISYDHPRRRQGFYLFADALMATTMRLFGARPHWGKHAPIGADDVRRLYPRLAEFQEVCESFDVAGSFRNEWVDRLLFDRKPESESKPEGASDA